MTSSDPWLASTRPMPAMPGGGNGSASGFGGQDYTVVVDYAHKPDAVEAETLACGTGAVASAAVLRAWDASPFGVLDLVGNVWQWNHAPDDTRWSLKERPGFLRLHSLPASDLWWARNSLTQRAIGPQSTPTTVLETAGMKPGDVAGLALLNLEAVGELQGGDHVGAAGDADREGRRESIQPVS